MFNKHPNQSFIDNFLNSKRNDRDSFTQVYSKEFTEKKRKEKFKLFLESNNNQKFDNAGIKKTADQIFNYNTLSTVKPKDELILEQSGKPESMPSNFNYNGLLYTYQPELNMFVNQHGHSISIEQATAFMEMNEFEGMVDASADGDYRYPRDTEPPLAPTGFTGNVLPFNDILASVTFGWTDNSTNEQGYKLFFKIQ